MLKYIIYFIIFSWAGWIADTIMRSIETKKYSTGTYIPFFGAIYGFGGVILLLLFRYADYPFEIHVILGGIVVTLLELSGGFYCEKVLKKRLWDYSKKKYNYHGHIDAEHTIYWFILAFILRLIFPYLP